MQLLCINYNEATFMNLEFVAEKLSEKLSAKKMLRIQATSQSVSKNSLGLAREKFESFAVLFNYSSILCTICQLINDPKRYFLSFRSVYVDRTQTSKYKVCVRFNVSELYFFTFALTKLYYKVRFALFRESLHIFMTLISKLL